MTAGHLAAALSSAVALRRVVRVGDEVVWKGNFGSAPAQVVRVVSMEVTDLARSKYGESRAEVLWSLVAANRVVFTLSSGTWAYGEQIRPLPERAQ